MIDDAALARNDDAELTLEELRTLYNLLNEALASRKAAYKEAETESRRESDGSLLDPADAAGHLADSEAASRDAERAWREIQEIEAALTRIRSGEYGVCEDSGEPIGYPRLARMPWARRTVAAEIERERLS